jgi:hypothetical protein
LILGCGSGLATGRATERGGDAIAFAWGFDLGSGGVLDRFGCLWRSEEDDDDAVEC